jgi:uridylate kinase
VAAIGRCGLQSDGSSMRQTALTPRATRARIDAAIDEEAGTVLERTGFTDGVVEITQAVEITESTSRETSADLQPSGPDDGLKYHRVLLKLSGEAFGGGQVGLDPDVVRDIAREVAEAVRYGVQVAMVIGGGNFFRGAELQQRGMDRARADYMGMLGIVMNCLALQDFLEKEGIETRVQTAITMGQVAEPYIPRRAIRHLEKGRVVIFGAGAGMPFFSTDTVAAQRALEAKCEVILMAKNGVDGVYTADPRIDPTAVKLDQISYSEALARGLKVADATAFALCMENGMPMIVFGMEGEGNVVRAVRGERIGTLVTAG